MNTDAKHELAPRPWALVSFFVLSVFAIAVLASLLGLSAVVVIVAPAVGTWFFGRSARVTIDRTGVRLASSSCRWPDIELRASRWGASLRSRPGVPRKSRLVVFFPMYLADWESHPISNDLRRWAPHLEISR